MRKGPRMIYICKNCNGNVVYSPEKHKMYCPYCDSIGSDELKNPSSAGMNVCPECGGEIQLEEHTSATKCPYCDSYLILNERVSGQYAPELIISFHVGKEKCKEDIRKMFHKNTFAPTDFLYEVRLNEMHGYYVPFWLFDYKVTEDFHGEGKKLRVWSSGNTEYTETSIYDIRRSMDLEFNMLPADASIQMPDGIMDLMEPYNYTQLEPFDPKYMSGFYAEKYNMEAEFVEKRAKTRMEESAKSLMKESYAGYNSVREISNDLRINDRQTHFGMLPIWRYNYEYKGKTYPFYVNGQTGKIVGEPPLSKGKIWAYAGTLWACLTGILVLADMILGKF